MSLVVRHPHRWDLSPEEARELQESLSEFVETRPLLEDALQYVAGVDAGFTGSEVHAAAVVLDYPDLKVIEQTTIQQPVTFPYIPGLLSFREAPAILAALERLPVLPDLLLVDGHGLAHPRRFGIACHLGVLLDIPTIGVAKSLLVGRLTELGEEIGSSADLMDEEEIIGAALRTRRNVRPVYISIGNRVDLPSAMRTVLHCTKDYRLPEPCRLAHNLATRSFKVGGS